MDENLEKMQKFFELDLKIKELIIKMKPPKLNYDEHYYMKYVDELLLNLKNIEEIYNYFVDYLKMGPFIKDLIKQKFTIFEARFITCNYEYDKLQKEYEYSISSMSAGIEDVVANNFFGYSGSKNELDVMQKCNTINDMLHAFHFYLVNNEKFYEQIPIINVKILESDSIVNLCGKNNELARDLFNNFPEEIKTEKTDILSFENMILIMARDLGHALTIEIHEEGDNLRVNYFIPKACNIEKLNKLKGVKKLDPNNSGIYSTTTGEFVVNRDNFTSEMVEFLKAVPINSDANMMPIRFN